MLGNYLLDRLYAKGVGHIFGIPGDYILRFNQLIEAHPIQFINTTRENTAGYMADAYGRIKGLGVACVTYGVGVNIVNALSQALVEKSPLVVISGAPGQLELRRSNHLHHLISRPESFQYENTQLQIFKPVTAYQALLNNPLTAAEEINRALDIAWYEKKPVYIELPRDMVEQPISSAPFSSYLAQNLPSIDLKDLSALLEIAKHPIIWAGHEVLRFNLAEAILAFAEQYSIPIATTLQGKSAFDERHPLVIGVYNGELSRPDISHFVNQSDAALVLGVIETDVDTGMFTAKIPRLPHRSYNGGHLKAVVENLSSITLSQVKNTFPLVKPKNVIPLAESDHPITMQRVLDKLQNFITDQILLIADVGDSLFGASDLIVTQNNFLSNAYFEALGFAVPAALGAAIAHPQKRVIALVGDGAFQITGTELSTAIRYGLDPIIILLNNKGYGTERPLLEGPFNDIVNWNYHRLPEFFGGGKGCKVTSEKSFTAALKEALMNRGQFHLIEVDLDKYDYSNAGKRFAALASKTVKR